MAPRRPSVSDSLGKDAFTEPAPQADPPAAPAQRVRPGRKRKGAGWDATNKLRSFYCPDDVWDEVQLEVDKGERSKTQVIVDALRQYLDVPDPEAVNG